MNNEYSVEEFAEEIAHPGRILLFIDDGGTPGKLLPNLVKNYKIYAGIIFLSDNYREFDISAKQSLDAIGANIKEFHAKEVVNPPSNSPWRGLSQQVRLNTLSEWGAFLKKYSIDILHLSIGSEQYDEFGKSPLVSPGKWIENHEQGLEKVFLINMLTELRNTYKTEDIIFIQDAKANQVEPVFKPCINPDLNIFKNSIFYLPSEMICGLQLADLAAYLLNRLHHIQNRAQSGKISAFDLMIFQIYNSVKDMTRNVLLGKRVKLPAAD